MDHSALLGVMSQYHTCIHGRHLCGLKKILMKMEKKEPIFVVGHYYQIGICTQLSNNPYFILDRHVLTAAHCAYNDSGRLISPKKIKVYLAVHNVFGEKRRRFHLSQIIPHESYDGSVNDIAILVLKKPMKYFFDKIRPICLPPKPSDLYTGRNVIAVGWGYNPAYPNDDMSADLQNIIVEVKDLKECIESWSMSDDIVTRYLCTFMDNIHYHTFIANKYVLELVNLKMFVKVTLEMVFLSKRTKEGITQLV